MFSAVDVNGKVANDKTLRSHCREGEAGYDALMKRPTGDTMRSETVSTKFHQLVAQANMLVGLMVIHQCLTTLIAEEPYDRIGHVRICGGAAGNSRSYPEPVACGRYATCGATEHAPAASAGYDAVSFLQHAPGALYQMYLQFNCCYLDRCSLGKPQNSMRTCRASASSA